MLLAACNKVENASPKILSKITLDKISTITKIIKAKPEETKAVIENIKASQLARKSAGARKMEDGDETEEDMAQIESELSNMQNNPNDALVSIANEYQGDEKIALMEIMYTGGSYQAFSERYSHLGVDLSEQFAPEGTYNAFQNQNARINAGNSHLKVC